MKNKYITYGLFLILFTVFWNLIDFLYATVITHSGYRFGAGTDLLIPIVVACVSGYLLVLRRK